MIIIEIINEMESGFEDYLLLISFCFFYVFCGRIVSGWEFVLVYRD